MTTFAKIILRVSIENVLCMTFHNHQFSGKPTIFDQIGHCQANISWQQQKTKLQSVPRGKADNYERSCKEHS